MAKARRVNYKWAIKWAIKVDKKNILWESHLVAVVEFFILNGEAWEVIDFRPILNVTNFEKYVLKNFGRLWKWPSLLWN